MINHAPHPTETTNARTTLASPYHLTEDQIRSFDEHGYLLLRKRVQGDLLARMQEAGRKWIELGQAAKTSPDPIYDVLNRDDFRFAKRSNGRSVFFRVDYLHNKLNPDSLVLLGSPEVLGVAESLNGPNFVPTYESMVFKMPGDGEIIPWHQDAWSERQHRTWNYDLYLDHSRKEAGALRVLPRSQRQKHDACKAAETYGWEHPDIITVEMEPGDVLIHDTMVLHGSPATAGGDLRRTIYYEFRSAEQILAEGPWGPEWIDQRLRLIPLALERHAEAYPDSAQFQWNVSAEFRPAPAISEAEELRVAHIQHSPGAYCSATST